MSDQRAERRRAARDERQQARARALGSQFTGLTGDETCDRCGRHLDDGPPGVPTMSVEFQPGRYLFACGWCAPDLRAVLRTLAGG